MTDGEHSDIRRSNIYDGQIYERLNPLVEKVTGVLFRKIDFDDESLKTLTELSGEKQHVVYASFHSSNISLLILYNLLRRHNFEIPALALEYNPFLLQAFGFVWRRIIKFFNQLILRKKYAYVLDTDYVKNIVLQKKSIILSLLSQKYFVKRYMEVKYDSLLYLVEVQKEMDSPILILPQMIFWNRNPERTAPKTLLQATPRDLVASTATGDKGLFAGWMATLKSISPAFVRIATPINLKEEIQNSRSDDSRQIALELRNKLLGMYHQEKRTVLGPVLKSRQEMAEKVLYHKNVLNEIARLSAEDGISENKLRKRAYKFYREIAADYSIMYIIFLRIVLEYVFRKIYDGIHYDPDELKNIREAAQKGPLVLTPCHKSHMDYLIISYLFYMNNLFPPHIAAGVNLSFFPLGVIFRHSGAFFLRRSFKGLKLYPVIFKQYVKTLVSEGYSIEFFIEGGRTRTGKLVFPKLGFLSYLTEAIEEGYNRDLMFVPISINYDRILEESSYVQELKGKEKESESMATVVESRKFLKRKYGKVYVRFNKPFSIGEIRSEGRDSHATSAIVANTVIRKINEITVVTPFALTSAAILLTSVKGFSRTMLAERIAGIYDFFEFSHVSMSDPLRVKGDVPQIVDYVIAAYLQDKILGELRVEGSKKKKEVLKDFYVLKEDDRARIVFYKNSIIHYLVALAFGSLALLTARKKGNLSDSALREEYIFIKDLFSNEFMYAESDNADSLPVPDKIFNFFLMKSYISRADYATVLNEDKLEDLKYFSKIVQDYLESYFIAVHTIMNQRPRRQGRREVIADIRKNGVRMYHTGEIHLSESLSLPNYQNALSRFVQEGIAVERVVSPKQVEITLADREKCRALYDRIKGYLECMP